MYMNSWAGLKPIAPNWVLQLLLSVQVHTTTHCRLYIQQELGTAPPKPGPDEQYYSLNNNSIVDHRRS